MAVKISQDWRRRNQTLVDHFSKSGHRKCVAVTSGVRIRTLKLISQQFYSCSKKHIFTPSISPEHDRSRCIHTVLTYTTGQTLKIIQIKNKFELLLK